MHVQDAGYEDVRDDDAGAKPRKRTLSQKLKGVLGWSAIAAHLAAAAFSLKKTSPSKKQLLQEAEQSQQTLEARIDPAARSSSFYLGAVSTFQVAPAARQA